jgi:guanylate kinase
MGRFIILSGPSCVGKGPLHSAFSKFYPEMAASLHKLVLYNCRSPRPGERTIGSDRVKRSNPFVRKKILSFSTFEETCKPST